MNNKWIFIGTIYVIALALVIYSFYAKAPEKWFALSIGLMLLGVYYFRRSRYIKGQ